MTRTWSTMFRLFSELYIYVGVDQSNYSLYDRYACIFSVSFLTQIFAFNLWKELPFHQADMHKFAIYRPNGASIVFKHFDEEDEIVNCCRQFPPYVLNIWFQRRRSTTSFTVSIVRKAAIIQRKLDQQLPSRHRLTSIIAIFPRRRMTTTITTKSEGD